MASETEDESFYGVSAETADIFWKEFNQRLNVVKTDLGTVTGADKLETLKPCKKMMNLLQKCKKLPSLNSPS
jgi:hypothetical protein